jgi:hypothetical protein
MARRRACTKVGRSAMTSNDSGPVDAPLLEEDEAEVVVGGGVLAVEPERSLERLARGGELPLLVAHHAEGDERGGVHGRGVRHGALEDLRRLGEPALEVQREAEVVERRLVLAVEGERLLQALLGLRGVALREQVAPLVAQAGGVAVPEQAAEEADHWRYLVGSTGTGSAPARSARRTSK